MCAASEISHVPEADTREMDSARTPAAENKGPAVTTNLTVILTLKLRTLLLSLDRKGRSLRFLELAIENRLFPSLQFVVV